MRSPRLRERITQWLLGLIERCAYAVLPRGPLRRRLLQPVHRALERPHVDRCTTAAGAEQTGGLGADGAGGGWNQS